MRTSTFSYWIIKQRQKVIFLSQHSKLFINKIISTQQHNDDYRVTLRVTYFCRTFFWIVECRISRLARTSSFQIGYSNKTNFITDFSIIDLEVFRLQQRNINTIYIILMFSIDEHRPFINQQCKLQNKLTYNFLLTLNTCN